MVSHYLPKGVPFPFLQPGLDNPISQFLFALILYFVHTEYGPLHHDCSLYLSLLYLFKSLCVFSPPLPSLVIFLLYGKNSVLSCCSIFQTASLLSSFNEQLTTHLMHLLLNDILFPFAHVS